MAISQNPAARMSALAVCLSLAVPALAAPRDYPTEALADYVFACMKANGESRDMLSRCSCSIDVIADLMPYENYEKAETFLSMGQVKGEKGVIFRTSELARDRVEELRRAQAEAEIRCF